MSLPFLFYLQNKCIGYDSLTLFRPGVPQSWHQQKVRVKGFVWFSYVCMFSLLSHRSIDYEVQPLRINTRAQPLRSRPESQTEDVPQMLARGNILNRENSAPMETLLFSVVFAV